MQCHFCKNQAIKEIKGTCEKKIKVCKGCFDICQQL